MAEPIPGSLEARLDKGAEGHQIGSSPWWLSFGAVAGLSLLLWDIAWVTHYAVRWTEPAVGVAWGLVPAVLVYPVGWALLILPWLVLIHRWWLWQGWMAGRTLAALAPAVVVFGWQTTAAVHYRPDPKARFESFSQRSLPAGVRVLEYYFSGGGLVDEKDAFVFRCTPEQTEALIHSLKVDRVVPEEKHLLRAWKTRTKQFRFLNKEEWNGLEKYSSANHPTPKFFELWTDAGHDQVLVVMTDF